MHGTTKDPSSGYSSVLRHKALWTLLSLMILALLVAFAHQAGHAFDDPDLAQFGRLMGAYKQTAHADTRLFSFSNIRYYGGLVEYSANSWANFWPRELFLARREVGTLYGWLGIIGVFLFCLLHYDAKTALLSGILLLLSPVYLGHLTINTKDIPFSSFFMLTLIPMVSCLRQARVRWFPLALFYLGLSCALNVRIGSLLILSIFGAAWLGLRVMRRDWPKLSSLLLLAIAHGIGLTALLQLGTIYWPWAHEAPFARVREGLDIMSNFPWTGYILVAGKMYPATALPWFYLPLHFYLQLTLAVLVGLLIVALEGSRCLTTKTLPLKHLDTATWTLLSAIAIPFAYVLLSRPVIYDGLRHFLFLFPPMCILAARGWLRFYDLVRPRAVMRLFMGCGLAALLALPLRFTIREFPNHYVYYNELLGGPARAFGKFEMDYWGQCVTFSLKKLEAEAQKQRKQFFIKAINDGRMGEVVSWALPHLTYSGQRAGEYYTVTPLRDTPEKLDELLARTDRFDQITVDGTPICLTFYHKATDKI